MTRTTAEDRLPGDPTPREVVARTIRVDHAGEYGAKRIYEGQLAVLRRTRHGPIIEHMKAQEQVHLGDDEAELKEKIEQFRAEELEHRDIGLEHEAEQAPAYRLLSAAIKAGCKVAIKVSERV